MQGAVMQQGAEMQQGAVMLQGAGNAPESLVVRSCRFISFLGTELLIKAKRTGTPPISSCKREEKQKQQKRRFSMLFSLFSVLTGDEAKSRPF